MKSILESLYAWLPADARGEPDGPEYAALADAVYDFVEEMGDRLPFEEAEKLRAFFLKACRLRDMEAAAAFANGCKMGAKLMRVLGEE